MANSVTYFSLAILCSYFKVCPGLEDDLEGRVIDGEYAEISHYPHAVFLEVIKKDESTHICGSSVVNQHFLLTAAHCFTYKETGKKDKIVAYAGHEDIKKANIVRKTRFPIVHERFDINSVQNDIALVYLPKKLPLGRHVKRIIIKRSFPLRATGALAGWGIINEITYEETMLLKSIRQTLKNKHECSRVISGPGTLCAGSLRSSDPRPAEGDSGSGLLTEKYQLIGLLSFKLASHPALPVYTNVSYYYNWIQYQVRSIYCDY